MASSETPEKYGKELYTLSEVLGTEAKLDP